jgi:ATP-binding cassette subfamily B protein
VSSIGGGVAAVLNFAALVASALILSPVTGLVALVGLSCMVFLMRPLLVVNRRWSERRVNSQRLMTSRLIERLELSRDLRAFGVDTQADHLVLESVDEVSSALRRVRFLNRLNSVLYRLGAFVMVLAMLALIDGRDASNLAALTGALLILLRSLSYGQASQAAYQAINEAVPVIGQLAAEERRLREVTHDGVSRTALPDTLGDIEFENVDYAYPGESAVLHDISFSVRAGEFAAIVGPSGSGKSTIMALLLQLRVPTGGTISASGVPLDTIDRSRWHERVAYVPQEPKLQSGTVRDAIRFHRPWISDDDIVRAAESAHVAEEIRAWPAGFDTPVGQLGDQLSGGQRQRIALARALAGRPELLLLDEPTSALDPRSERLITDTLRELRGEMTLVVIAHRHATIERASTLIEVDGGRIVDFGAVTARSPTG